MSQTMEGGGICHLFHQTEITMQVLTFLGEGCGHLIDKRLLTVSKTELLTLQGNDIIAVGVETTEQDTLCRSQIAGETRQSLVFICTANEVHTRLEADATTGEALQTAAYLRGLLKDGYLVTVLGQDHTARQSAQSATYDDNLLHVCI